MSIPADVFKAAFVKLREADKKNRTHCPKCGKRTYEMRASAEAAADLAAMGYDGTCCWPGWDEIAGVS